MNCPFEGRKELNQSCSVYKTKPTRSRENLSLCSHGHFCIYFALVVPVGGITRNSTLTEWQSTNQAVLCGAPKNGCSSALRRASRPSVLKSRLAVASTEAFLFKGVRGSFSSRHSQKVSGYPLILGLTLIALKKDDVLSDKYIIYPLTSCLKCAKIA